MSQSKERILELNARLAQNLTDKGVEAMADETTTALVDKVAEVSGGDDDFVGIKYSDFDEGGYKLPHTADARSLDKIYDGLLGITASNASFMAANLFMNDTPNPNGGLNTQLEKVYMPCVLTSLKNTFRNCSHLTTIIGDLSSVTELYGTFYNCNSLADVPYMPNLSHVRVSVFYNCTGLTSITFHKMLTTFVSNAFQGCVNITEINLPNGWNINSYFQYCEKLTQASLHDMIEKYADMTGQTSPVMNVGSSNLAKIDDEHKAMATAKNITLA